MLVLLAIYPLTLLINNYGLKHCMSIKGHECCLGQDLVKRSNFHFDLMDHINCSHLM